MERNYNHLFYIRQNKAGLNLDYSNKIAVLFLLIARMEKLLEPYAERVCRFYEESCNMYTREDLEEKIFGMVESLPFFRTSKYSFLDILMNDKIGVSDINNYFNSYDSKTARELASFNAIDILVSAYNNGKFRRENIRDIYRTVRHENEQLWQSHLMNTLQNVRRFSYWTRLNSNDFLSEVMSSIIGCQINAEIQDIYDPACGFFGGSLISLHHWLKSVSNVKCVNIYGQDKMYAHSASLITKVVLRRNVHISLADSMLVDNNADMKFDLIVSALPLKAVAPNAKLKNPIMGVAPSKDATLFYVRHIIEKLKSNGRAVFTMAPSTFTLKSNNEYVLSLIDSDIIDAIILLPKGFTIESSIDPCLCVIDKNKPVAHKGKIQVIDFGKLLADTDGFYDKLGENTISKLHETMRKYENDNYSRIIDNRAMFQYDVAIKSPDGRKLLNVIVPGEVNDAVQYVNYNYLTHLPDGVIDYSSITRFCGIDFGKLFVEEIEEPSFEEMERETEDIMRKVNSAFRKLLNEQMGSMMVSESEPSRKCMLIDVANIYRYREPKTVREKQLPIEDIATYDVLVYNNKKGLTGKVARGGDELIHKRAFCIKANDKKILPDYLYYILKSKEEEIANLTKGSTTPSISIFDLQALKIELPTIYEQSKIVDQLKERIDAVNELLPMLGGNAKETVEKYATALIKETLGNK